MPSILPLSPRIEANIRKHSLQKKWKKQINLLTGNPRHPSLNVELLEPKKLGIYSFRIDRKYRAIFIWRDDLDAIEILAVTVHYS